MPDRSVSLEWLLVNRHAEIPAYVIYLDPTETHPPPGSPEFEAVFREHLLYWWELEERGQLLAAGPVDLDTDRPRGMAIVLADSREEAELLAGEEPFARRGFRRNTVHAWQLNEGLAVPATRAPS
jgi:uncharacterized protein YciI